MKTLWSKLPGTFGRIASGTAALIFCCLPALGQSSPPMMVQVPFISVAAGNIVSGAAVTGTPAAACTAGLPAMGASATGAYTSADNYGDGCPANEVAVDLPWGTTVDAWGNVYFADSGHFEVRVIYAGATTVNGVANPATTMIEAAYANGASWGAWGTVTPVAGDVYSVAGGYSAAISAKNSDSNFACSNVTTDSSPDALSADGSGCPANYAYLKAAYSPAVDSAGNVFIADKGNSLIYVIIANAGSPAAQLVTLENPSVTSPQVGYIYQIVGDGGGWVDNVLANNAGKVHAPYSVAVDSSENLYIADYSDDAIRMVNGPNNSTSGGVAAGFIHTIAGAGYCSTADCAGTPTALSGTPSSGVVALGASFDEPGPVAVDSSGNVYVGDDSDNTTGVPATVRVIYAGGANNSAAGLICLEQGISSSSCSTTLVAGDVYTVAGYKAGGTSGAGAGLPATASGVNFDRIEGLGLDSHGNLYIVDYGSHSEVSEVNAQTGLLVYLSADGEPTSTAKYGVAGNDYCATGTTTGSGPIALDEYGDGCPAPQSNTDNAEGNIGIDSSGNLYYADEGDGLLRKLTFNGTLAANLDGTTENMTVGRNFPATTAHTTAATQYLAFLLLTGGTGDTVSSVSPASVLTQGAVNTQGDVNPEFSDVGGADDSCSNSTTLVGLTGTSDNTADSVCIVPVMFTPGKAGARSGVVQLSGTITTSPQPLGTAYVNGIGNAADLVIDPSAATAIGSGTGPRGVATDSAGNTYIAWTNGSIYSTPGGTLATAGTGLTNPHQVAVDGAGNVYVADTGADRIAEFVGGATTPVAVVSGLSGPEGVALDSAGNLYIADTGNARILFQPNGDGLQTILGSGFTFQTPVSVAVDAGNNVFVADSGLGEIIEIPAATGTTPVILDSGIAPVSVAVDPADDVYYADSTSLSVVELPAHTSYTEPFITGLTTPIGIALDPNGGVYVADEAGTTGISYYSRTASTQNFASTSDTLNAALTNIGNQDYSEAFTQSDSTDFTVTGTPSNGCGFTLPTGPFVLAPGTNCGLQALFTPSATGNLSDTISFNGGPTLTLTGTNVGSAVGTTTTLGSLSPASPIYGTSASVTVTVAPAGGSAAPTGTVSLTVDGGTATSAYTLTASGSDGTYIYTLPTLSAGSHSITAAYTPSGSGFNASITAAPLTVSVAQLAITATVTTATPVDVTYGHAIPTISGTLTGVLGSDSANVTPVFDSTASAGSTVNSGTPYPITVSLTGSAASNYSVTLNGTPGVVIQPATVNVTVNSTTKIYGAANPTFAGTLTGVYGTDPVTANYSTTATQYSAVNGATGYPITSTGLTLTGSATGNYTLGTVTPGTLTITPLAITASVTSPVDTIYGSAIPALTGSLTGVVNGDNVSAAFATTAVVGSAVGSYPITLATTPLTGSAAGNYTVTLTGTPMVAIQPLAITAAATPESVAYGLAIPAPTGTLTGVLSGDASNISASFTTTAAIGSPVGDYPITLASPPLTGPAAGNYTVTLSGTAEVAITQVATTTGLTEMATSVGIGSEASFTATVASTGGTPTGSVVFTNGSTTLCTLTLVSISATCSTPSLPVGNQSVIATYNGTTNFAGSVSAAVTEIVTEPVVTGTPTGSSTVTIAGGASGTVTLGITAVGGYTGTATYACAFLPADMTCTFDPPTSTFTSTNTTATTVLTISTKPTTTAALRMPERTPGQSAPNLLTLSAGILLPGALLGLLGFGKRRRQWQRRIMLMVLLIAGMAGMAAISGCGGSSSTNQTPPGTYNIQVEITAGTVQTVPLTVVVQ